MQPYKISVVIPTYNTGSYLISAIDSVINQTIGFENIELLLVDDKSTDDYTINLLKEYDSKYENCKAIFLDVNSGYPGTPRNAGLENATGDCIIFMDHDDSYVLNAFETMHDKLIEEDSDFVISTYTHIRENDENMMIKHLGAKEIKISSIDDNIDFLKLPPSIWTKLFKREFLLDNNIKFIERMLAEDVELFTHALLCGRNIVYMGNFSSYNYKIREKLDDASVIHTYNKKYLSAMVKGYFKTLDLLAIYEKEDYFSMVFNGHIKFWMECFSKSSISFDDKIDLIEEISPILKKGFENNISFLNDYCISIKDNLFKNEYVEVVKKLEDIYKYYFDIVRQNKKLKSKNKKLKKENQKLKSENKKINKENNSYKKLLDTKPYRFAKLIRSTAKKVKH